MLYYSYNIFVKPHLEYAVLFCFFHQTKEIAKLGLQHRAIKTIHSMRYKLYEERLLHLNLFSLEKCH